MGRSFCFLKQKVTGLQFCFEERAVSGCKFWLIIWRGGGFFLLLVLGKEGWMAGNLDE